jgi:hypothetical protein
MRLSNLNLGYGRTLKEGYRANDTTSQIYDAHAGVYPTLDIQQLATHALPMDNAMLT